jgi:hypothetical protein
MQFDAWSAEHPVVSIPATTFDEAVRALIEHEERGDAAGVEYRKQQTYREYSNAPLHIDAEGNFFQLVPLSPSSDVVHTIEVRGEGIASVFAEANNVRCPVTPNLLLIPAASQHTPWRLRVVFQQRPHPDIILDVTYAARLYAGTVRESLATLPLVTAMHRYANGVVRPAL